MKPVDATRLLVRDLLERPLGREWTLQGLGMLRTYLSKEVRLHIWDKRYAVPGVSELHTHPWDFSSLVVAGVVRNVRHLSYSGPTIGLPYIRQALRCGAGGGLQGVPEPVFLAARDVEYYDAGTSYRQTAGEIHRSVPEDGTVTLVQREFYEDKDAAHVFWPDGQVWVSAEPRPATDEEVLAITGNALKRWFA